MSDEQTKLLAPTPENMAEAGKNPEAPAEGASMESNGQVMVQIGFHTELNIPLVILQVGTANAAMDPNACRQLALQMIGAALVSEQQAAQRHAPVLAQATAAAMQAINKRKS